MNNFGYQGSIYLHTHLYRSRFYILFNSILNNKKKHIYIYIKLNKSNGISQNFYYCFNRHFKRKKKQVGV